MRALLCPIRPLLFAMLVAAACCPPQCVSAGDQVARPAARPTTREAAPPDTAPTLSETLLQWGEDLGVIEPTNEGGGGRRRIVKLLILAFILGAQ
jgi:hypothetical protein